MEMKARLLDVDLVRPGNKKMEVIQAKRELSTSEAAIRT
jgi:hypothetical protein